MHIVVIDGKERQVDGIINTIKLPNGKIYALQACLTAIKPITCPQCGGRVEISFGEGQCEYCDTRFTSRLERVSN